MDFLGRCIPACLLTGADYMAAQRERRRINLEMSGIYRNFDVLLSVGAFGPAPRLDQHSTAAFWQKPSPTTPFNVTGGPAIVLPMGFSADGLPLSLQLAGRPFDDATVLRLAHAYEGATEWHKRRPPLDVERPTQSWQGPTAQKPERASISADERDAVARAVKQAGLTLSDEVFEQVCCAVPALQAMQDRLKARAGDRFEEPAGVYGNIY